MPTLPKRDGTSHQDKDHRSGVARATLIAGGGFATAIGTILGAAGVWGLGDRPILYALVALFAISALTMGTAARMLRP